MGTSSWVIPVFDRVAGEHDIAAVFTRAPKPTGRKQILTKSPVHIWAEQRGIPVYTSTKDFDNVNDNIQSLDAIVVASYGVILRDNVLNAARLGCINIHPSLLPKYRGPAPIVTAVLNGDTQSGVCIMKVTADVDAGDVFMCRPFAIGENDNNADVEKLVGEMSTDMLSEFLAAPEKYPARPQVGTPTFTRKFTGDDEIIDWSRSPRVIHNLVRAIGGRTKINGMDVKILETKISANQLEIIRVKPAGKKTMPWRDFVNGQRGKIEFGEGINQKDSR